jgi:DNA-binding NarL/FixJ family response regulator
LEADAEHGHDPRRLSNSERAILEQLTYGASPRHIARALNASESTVRIYLGSLLRKLGVRNRTEAAMLGMQKRTTLFL